MNNLVRADGLALFPFLQEQFVVFRHAGKRLDLTAAQLMVACGERLVVNEDFELWHLTRLSALGILDSTGEDTSFAALRKARRILLATQTGYSFVTVPAREKK